MKHHKLARNVKHFRTALNMYQPELADKTGLSQQAISTYERGIRRPSFGTLLRLSEALKTSPCNIDPEFDIPIPNELAQIILMWTTLTRKEKLAISSVARTIVDNHQPRETRRETQAV